MPRQIWPDSGPLGPDVSEPCGEASPISEAKLSQPTIDFPIVHLTRVARFRRNSPALPRFPLPYPAASSSAPGKPDHTIEEFIQPGLRIVDPASPTSCRRLHSMIARDYREGLGSRVCRDQFLQQVVRFGVTHGELHGHTGDLEFTRSILGWIGRIKHDARAPMKLLIDSLDQSIDQSHSLSLQPSIVSASTRRSHRRDQIVPVD